MASKECALAIESSSGEPIRRSGTDWGAALELQRAVRTCVSRVSRTSNDRWPGRYPAGNRSAIGLGITVPLRLFTAYRLASASHHAAEELDPPGD